MHIAARANQRSKKAQRHAAPKRPPASSAAPRAPGTEPQRRGRSERHRDDMTYAGRAQRGPFTGPAAHGTRWATHSTDGTRSPAPTSTSAAGTAHRQPPHGAAQRRPHSSRRLARITTRT